MHRFEFIEQQQFGVIVGVVGEQRKLGVERFHAIEFKQPDEFAVRTQFRKQSRQFREFQQPVEWRQQL